MLIELLLHDDTILLPVRAQPGARKNAVTGIHDRALKVSVTVAPENGKANVAIIKLLSQTLGITKSSIELHSGATNRNKKFAIRGVTKEQLLDRLQACVAETKGDRPSA